MPETQANIGYDSEFAIGDGGDPETFTAIAEVVSITPPGLTRDKEEATHLKSPDKYKEYVMALFDTGDVSLTLNWVPSETDTLFDAFHADPGNMQITFPNGVRMQFVGAFAGYETPELSPIGKMEATATVTRTSGKPQLLAAE
ncbi:phage tail tube protein [Roseovarius sp. MMSF_3281]|uniref:phage tail tube protein n=1 Tax=Roseovarius sp. MMSF_3281 TaxID=3046694 RepID=UPI00273F528E|nr:phage tail tube protein [Roseovarius sp. MMSF_3281]